MTPETRYTYTVGPFTDADVGLLGWLSARGYDGNFEVLADYAERKREGTFYFFSEPAAWEFQDYVDGDPDAFLACCGSENVSTLLIDFLGRIV